MSYMQYYKEILYPEQDKILSILKSCELPFYLTGGTAVSRGYFNHRFSDDLDLFVNNDSNFQKDLDRIFDALEKAGINIEFSSSSPDYQRIYVDKGLFGLSEKGLKIDFVNDIPFHVGSITETPVYYKTDSVKNILSNKYTAIYRISIKDAVDIREIAKHYSFNWAEIIQDANEKESGIDEKEVAFILSSFTENDFDKIKWINKPDFYDFIRDLETITKNILQKSNNSLFR